MPSVTTALGSKIRCCRHWTSWIQRMMFCLHTSSREIIFVKLLTIFLLRYLLSTLGLVYSWCNSMMNGVPNGTNEYCNAMQYYCISWIRFNSCNFALHCNAKLLFILIHLLEPHSSLNCTNYKRGLRLCLGGPISSTSWRVRRSGWSNWFV